MGRRSFACAMCVAVLVTLAVLMMSADAAVTQPYKLQRRVGESGAWETIGTFAVSRHGQQPARIKVSTPTAKDMTSAQKESFAAARLVSYRAFPSSADGKADREEEAVSVAVTPCTLIRDFKALDTQTVLLEEDVRVVPGSDASLLGLQVSSKTNFFHSKMLEGDECDRSVVKSLFPVVRYNTTIGIAQPASVATVKYEQMQQLMDRSNEEAKGGKGKKAAPRRVQKRVVRNADGEDVEVEVPVDDRGFLQKYWMYLVIPFAMSIIKNMGQK